ncbi:hypothetical protein ACQCT5_06550 [Sutcliffiella halmapala]
MGLDKKDRQHIEAILQDLRKVIKDIDSVSYQMDIQYRTVGGQQFCSPLMELKRKCEKAANRLNGIL